MIDPISMIVIALVQGALAGVKNIAADEVQSAYGRLKESIVAHSRRQAGDQLPAPGSTPQASPAEVQSALTALERDPTSIERQDAVERMLRQGHFEHDAEVVRLSGELFQLLEDPLRALGGDSIESAQRQAGVRALEHVMDDHIATVRHARERHHVADVALLSTGVETAEDLPPEVRGEIARLHVRIGLVIHQISQRIEGGKSVAVVESVRRMPLSATDRARAIRLIEADREIHVSYQRLRNTVEFFSRLNEVVLRRVEHEPDAHHEANMMLGNAVLIYELTAYVIDFIEEFAVEGEHEIEAIEREMVHHVAAERATAEQRRAQANADDIDPAVRRNVLADIEHREAALTALETEWRSYLADLEKSHATVNEVTAKLPTLRLLRENARDQIAVLQLVAMLRFLKQNANAIRGTIDMLTGFELAPLSPERVRRLLRVGDAA